MAFLRLALVALVSALGPGCILSPLDLTGRPCPCADGWRCVSGVCVEITGTVCTRRSDCRPTETCLDGRCLSFDAGPPCLEEPETCDGEDQDCDSRTDEGAGLCELESATASCASGACAIDRCHAGFDDCDMRASTGCETPLGTTDDCGECGDACTGATPFCAPGAGGALGCVASCPGTLTECEGACVDPDTDLHHCGGCDGECAPEHAMGRCTGGVCGIGACDPGWADCDDDDENGCEVSLAADATCGSCMRDCTAMSTPGTCMVGRCVGGACMVVSGGEGAICRPADSLCDMPERCDGAGNCPPDLFAAAGVACRNSTCGGLDPRELCTGTSGVCPPPCGCEGEPCCPGAVACNASLECDAGTCASCTIDPTLSGGFPMPAGGSPIARQVTGMTGAIRISDGMMASGTITLPTGVTASGAFTPPAAEWLTSIAASGATLTLTSGGIGTTPTVTTIMLTRATAMGTAMATPISPAIPGYFQSITTSGDTITFTDQGGATSTIRIVPAAGCP